MNLVNVGSLYVEGSDDQWVAINIFEKHGVRLQNGRGIQVKITEGIDQLLDVASVAVKSDGRVAFVLDADTDLGARWLSLSDRLAKAAVTLPSKPDPLGTVVSGCLPDSKVGIWLMPDNENAGILEDFLAQLIPSGDPTWDHAKSSAAHALTLGAPCRSIAASKAEIHTWLAWREPPGLPFGIAIKAKYFDGNEELTTRFADWFKRVFSR